MTNIKDIAQSRLGQLVQQRGEQIASELGTNPTTPRDQIATDAIDSSPAPRTADLTTQRLREIESALLELKKLGYSAADLERLMNTLPASVRSAHRALAAVDGALFAKGGAVEAYRTALKAFDHEVGRALAIPEKYGEAASRAQEAARKDPAAPKTAFNDEVLKFWPTAPRRFLLDDGRTQIGGQAGATSELQEIAGLLSDRTSSGSQRERQTGVERFVLPTLPSFLAAHKALLLLAEHLQSDALPTESEIQALKEAATIQIRSATNDEERAEVLRTLRGEAERLIIEVETLLGDNGLKRERMGNESNTDGRYDGKIELSGRTRSGGMKQTFGITTSRTAQGGLSEQSGSFSGTHHSKTVGFAEIANFGARQYRADLQPVGVSPPPEHRRLTQSELPWVAEKLLTARRIYELMRAEAPDSLEVAGLTRWMEDSTLSLGGADAVLSMGSLRADLLDLTEHGRYPKERAKVLEAEMNESAIAPKKNLPGLTAFEARREPRSPELLDAVVAEARSARVDRESTVREQVAVAVEPKPDQVQLDAAAQLRERHLSAFGEELRRASRTLSDGYMLGSYAISNLTQRLLDVGTDVRIAGQAELSGAVQSLLGWIGRPEVTEVIKEMYELRTNGLNAQVVALFTAISKALPKGAPAPDFLKRLAKEGALQVLGSARTLARTEWMANTFNFSNQAARNHLWGLRSAMTLLQGVDPEVSRWSPKVTPFVGKQTFTMAERSALKELVAELLNELRP